MSYASDGTKLTRIDGKGLWRSWTRNFKTPQLALLDLLDNCFDAAFTTDPEGHNAKVWIDEDEYDFPVRMSQATERETTGLVIINNSKRKINPLGKILEVYSSSKGSDSENIGENGVGLKQGCATISDLSIVLTKNKKKLSLGIIAASLQRREGCYLPSWEFESEDLAALELEMIDLFTSDDGVKNCFKIYGCGEFKVGVKRIKAHFQEMLESPTWEKDDHIFFLIMDKVRHGMPGIESINLANDDDSVSSDGDDFYGGTSTNYYKPRVNNLMSELRDSLPRQYLHVPDSFDVRVGGQKIDFKHWQKRLVELTEFVIHVGTKKNWNEDGLDLKLASKTLLDGFMKIRVFIGFDPMRKGPRKEANMLIYSRQMGRLIKFEADPRSLLRLAAGGSEFCQSLTIIVDDCHGVLPLNPTKQDIAFGERNDGETFKYNMYSWLSAVTYMYWKYNVGKFDGKKLELTEVVEGYRPKIEQKFRDVNFYVKPMDEMKLTKFQDVPWYNHQKKSIRNRRIEREILGEDTYFRIERKSDETSVSTSASKSASKSASTRKKRKAEISAAEPSPLKRRNIEKTSYAETTHESSSESSTTHIEFESQPIAKKRKKQAKKKQKHQKAKHSRPSTQAREEVIVQMETETSVSFLETLNSILPDQVTSSSTHNNLRDMNVHVTTLQQKYEELEQKFADVQKKNQMLGRDLDSMKVKERQYVSTIGSFQKKIRDLEEKVASGSSRVLPDILDL